MIFDVLWWVWIGAFVLIEGVALLHDFGKDKDGNGVKDDGPTLSEHLRKWFRLDTHLGRTAWIIVSVVFTGWFFIGHILLGVW